MAKHTPGPWQFERVDNRGWRTLRSDEGPAIGEVFDFYNQEGKDSVGTSNACLIAAAPELLAACEYALALSLGNVKGDRYDLQNAMQAIIAKAKGEKP